MQPNNQPEQWQQPDQTLTTPSPEIAPPVQPQPIEATPIEQRQTAPQLNPMQSQVQLEQTSEAANFSDEELVRWQANEHLTHQRTPIWYVVLGIAVLVLIVVAVFLVKSWTFAILIPVMAAALLVYAHRPPLAHNYILSRKGLYIDDKLLPYEDFKEFGVIMDDIQHSIVLIPRKRFQTATSVYFPEEVGESIVDILAARLPMKEASLDSVDRWIRKLKI